ncbi:hypothetical protein AGMMS49593_00190 [Endomicrobiia bacterium]|nr:hypothetical protein AGMMS49593_00190 [Endomicrobiia bacterium]
MDELELLEFELLGLELELLEIRSDIGKFLLDSTDLSGLRLNPAGVELGLKDELELLEFELLGLELELLEIGLFGLNECTATGGFVTDVDAVADSGDVVGVGVDAAVADL